MVNQLARVAVCSALLVATASPSLAQQSGGQPAAGDPAQGAVAVLMIVLLTAAMVYILPSMVASARGHHNALAIFVLNLLLGWTFLGWVAALVWAFTAVDTRYDRHRN